MLYTSNTFVPYNCNLKEAHVVFLGIPFSCNSDSRDFGPTILRESLSMIIDTESGNFVTNMNICDIGNLEIAPKKIEVTGKRIKETIKDIKKENSKAFFIFSGGDHSIILPILEELKPKTIINFAISNGKWVTDASKFSKIIQIGTDKNLNRPEIEKMDYHQLEKTIEKIEKPIHLTVNMNVFSEGFMEDKDAFEIIDLISPHISSIDIVEVNDYQLTSKRGMLAAELIQEVLRKKT